MPRDKLCSQFWGKLFWLAVGSTSFSTDSPYTLEKSSSLGKLGQLVTQAIRQSGEKKECLQVEINCKLRYSDSVLLVLAQVGFFPPFVSTHSAFS